MKYLLFLFPIFLQAQCLIETHSYRLICADEVRYADSISSGSRLYISSKGAYVTSPRSVFNLVNGYGQHFIQITNAANSQKVAVNRAWINRIDSTSGNKALIYIKDISVTFTTTESYTAVKDSAIACFVRSVASGLATLSDGDYGDVIVSGGGLVMTVDKPDQGLHNLADGDFSVAGDSTALSLTNVRRISLLSKTIDGWLSRYLQENNQITLRTQSSSKVSRIFIDTTGANFQFVNGSNNASLRIGDSVAVRFNTSGSVGQVLTVTSIDGDGRLVINPKAGGSGTANCEQTLTKASHGFSKWTPIYWNGSAWARPTFDSIIPTYIVIDSTTVNTFKVANCGNYSSTLTAGLYYYTGTSPGYTLTQPTIKTPLFEVAQSRLILQPLIGFQLAGGSGVSSSVLADTAAAIRADFPSGGGDLQTTTSSGDSTNLRLKVVKSNSRFIVSDSIAWYKRFISTTGLEGIVLENIRTEKYGNVYTSPYTGTTYRMGEWNRFLTRNWYNPGANRPGEVLTMDSYNASRSGGRLLTDEASWANVFESHYEQNRDQFEYYQQVILRDGYSFRPLSMYIGKKDSTNDARFQAHIFHVTPVGIEADMLNLKNGSLQIVRQSTAPPATLGQTWTEIVMAESTGSGNTFTTSNTGSGGVTFTQTATNATFNFNKTILGGTNVNIGASGGAMGKAFLTDLRITTPATVTSYPQFTLRLDDANNDVVKQKSSLIGTNASEDLIFYNSGNIRGTIDLLGKYYFGVTSERVATDAFLDVQGHNQTSTTGPPTSGTNSKAILRLSSRITTAVLDMGLSSNAHSYIQSTLSGNLASNRELRLNPNGGNVAIGNSTTDNSLYRLFVNGALGANNVSIGTGVSPTAILHLKAGTATASTSPLKFTLASHTQLSVPESGVLEPRTDGNGLLFTNVSGVRREIQLQSIFSIVANTTLDATHNTVIVPLGSAFTVTLPTASSFTSKIYRIVNKTAGSITIGSYVNLLGSTVTTLGTGLSALVQSDGTNWQQIQ